MFELISNNGLKYYKIDSFSKTGMVKHCFTTREGGVSKDEFSSMNLRFNCSDRRENVLKNFEIICSEIDINYKDLVLSNQVHEKNVITVGEEDRGNGIIFPNKFESADALITAKRGVPLVTFFADCVPIFFLDKKEGVIALAHSGWKGTVLNIAGAVLEKFFEEFNAEPQNIIAAIGPAIGVCCFEVGDDVSEIFFEKFGDSVLEKHENRWHVNLEKAVFTELKEAGVLQKNITCSGICTCDNSDLLFSHRKTKGKRGNMAAFLELR